MWPKSKLSSMTPILILVGKITLYTVVGLGPKHDKPDK